MPTAPSRESVISPPGAQSPCGFRVSLSSTDAVARVDPVTARVPEQPRDGKRKVPECPERENVSSAVQCVTTPAG
jgi:hypothetical protein